MVWSLFSKPALTRVLLPEPATPVKTVNTCLGIDVLRYLNCFVSQDRYYKNGSLHEYSLLNYVCYVMRYLSKYLKRVIHYMFLQM